MGGVHVETSIEDIGPCCGKTDWVSKRSITNDPLGNLDLILSPSTALGITLIIGRILSKNSVCELERLCFIQDIPAPQAAVESIP